MKYLDGCASKVNFKNAPINKSEFKKDINFLKAAYSDIEEYSTFLTSIK